MPSARFTIEGGEKLDKALIALGNRVRKKVLRKAVRKGAKPVIKTARQMVPRGTGLLKKSLGTKVKFYPRSGTAVAIVGPRTYFKSKKLGDVTKESARKPSKYAHLVEYGTKPHMIPLATFRVGGRKVVIKNFMHPGTPARPFMRPAITRNKHSYFSVVAAEVRKGIATEAKKVA